MLLSPFYFTPLQFGHKANNHHIKIKLLRVQRMVLLRACKAYRTAPTDSLCVLAGTLPIHLKAQQTSLLWYIKNKEQLNHRNYTLSNIPSYKDLIKTFNNNTIQDFLNNQAELFAILKALQTIQKLKFKSNSNINIYSDSKTALQAIANFNNNGHLVYLINKTLEHLKAKGSPIINLLWIKAHAGYTGNETADKLAKAAAVSDIPTSYNRILWSYIVHRVRDVFQNLWQEEWNSSTTGRITYSYFPSIENRLKNHHFMPNFLLTQVLTNHGNFNEYLCRFALREAHQSTCSGDHISSQNSNHLVFECDNYSNFQLELITHLALLDLPWPREASHLVAEEDTLKIFQRFVTSTKALQPSFPPVNITDSQPSSHPDSPSSSQPSS